MNVQHLSDEAIAAYADGVLTGLGRERARRHAESCRECAHAVRVQREAVLALRAAVAPVLPSALMARLRAVPTSTPLSTPPAVIGPDGTPMFAAYGTSSAGISAPNPASAAKAPRMSPMAAALVPSSQRWSSTRFRPIMRTAVAVAAAGAVAVASSAPAIGAGGSVQHGPAVFQSGR